MIKTECVLGLMDRTQKPLQLTSPDPMGHLGPATKLPSSVAVILALHTIMLVGRGCANSLGPSTATRSLTDTVLETSFLYAKLFGVWPSNDKAI